jgi:hypothetical protein
MRITQKINFFLLLILSLGLSACNINTPFAMQNSLGELKGNQLLIGRSFVLESENIIKGDIIGIGADLTLKPGSLVEGNILLFGSSLEVGGIVKGDLNLFAGNSRIIKSAILNGDINQFFQHVVLEQSAQVTGEISSFTFPGFPAEQFSGFISKLTEWFRPNRWLLWDLLRTLGLSFLALLAIILLRKSTTRICSQIQSQPFVAWGAGIFIALVTPFVALILMITICLLPIGLLLLMALALSYLLGWLTLGMVVGNLIQRWLQTHWVEEIQVFVGSLIFGMVMSIIGWIPCIGWLFNFIISCIGLGAVIITKFGVIAPRSNLIFDPITLVNEPPKQPEIKPMANKYLQNKKISK